MNIAELQGLIPGMVLIGLLLLLALVWIFLPFAVFGIKERLDKLNRIQTETNELLEIIASYLAPPPAPVAPDDPPPTPEPQPLPTVPCPHCGGPLHEQDLKVGEDYHCPHCNGIVEVVPPKPQKRITVKLPPSKKASDYFRG